MLEPFGVIKLTGIAGKQEPPRQGHEFSGDPVLVRFLGEFLNDRIGGVFVLVIVVHDPRSIRSRQINHHQSADEETGPPRPRTGENAAENQRQKRHRQDQYENEQHDFMKAELRDGIGHLLVGKTGSLQVVDQLPFRGGVNQETQQPSDHRAQRSDCPPFIEGRGCLPPGIELFPPILPFGDGLVEIQPAESLQAISEQNQKREAEREEELERVTDG